MGSKAQTNLIETFETTRPATPLFCHQEFLEKLAAHRGDGIARRAAFLMQRLAVDARRLHYKSTSGANRGWRRSRLGGNQGSHFYAWWAPRNAAPLQRSDDFPRPDAGAIILRDIRHHDDHSPLTPQSFEDNYLEVSVRDLRREEYTPTPWTPPQARFASLRQPVRLLKGHPGSGKTTALWNAADASPASNILYVTYSRDLAALAREYFDRYCSAHKRFEVVTFPDLVRRIAKSTAPPNPEAEAQARFLRDLYPFSRQLGAWSGSQVALFDEFHAHLIGGALPFEVGRFGACKEPRVSDRWYRERRARFIGVPAAATAIDIATRLERNDSGTLAERYFPELQLAWQALARLKDPARLDPELLGFECIAVDECQDLTPLEASVLVRLAAANNITKRTPIPFLLAGDEAQTVRPTDFEWGWLSDLLHAQIATPAEHRLTSNLRSPRRLAELVNRVWDLYTEIGKQDRPSGAGYAQIDDDATDQLIYCTATPGPDLDSLLAALASREGLAIITLDDTVPQFIPETVRPAVLTVREAKGLDFHSVCVLNAGVQVDRITREDLRFHRGQDIESLRKRLAIDQLRVALSRPTERLIWMDVNPDDALVRKSTIFLNRGGGQFVSATIPAAVLKALEEEELDLEERVQRCQTDARQFLEVRPELAWSRAKQAVTLLGSPDAPNSVTDAAARSAAYLTLAEVSFVLAMRGVRMPVELGRPDLFNEAIDAARRSERGEVTPGLIARIAETLRTRQDERLDALILLAMEIHNVKGDIDPWIQLEIESRGRGWIEEMESAVTNSARAEALAGYLPIFYKALRLSDAEARRQKIWQRAVQFLVKDKKYRPALVLLESLPERQVKTEAVCYEGLGMFPEAAERYRASGSSKDALRCYRLVPDIPAALELAREAGDEATAESLEWIGALHKVIKRRPESFSKVISTAEKKMLEGMLEEALGVTRVKAATKKAAVKKAPAKKAAATKGVAAKRARPRLDPF